jgi:hypothetical protein
VKNTKKMKIKESKNCKNKTQKDRKSDLTSRRDR